MRKSRGVTTYSGAHRNVTLRRGKAAAYACAQCGQGAKEWALRHDASSLTAKDGQTFSVDPNDYAPMCFRCHRIYDKSVITHCPKGHPYEGDNVLVDSGKRKCRTCVYARNRGRRLTREQRDRKNEYQRAYRTRGDVAA